MKFTGEKLEDYLVDHQKEMLDYNPYFKLDTPFNLGGGDYWYGFRCFVCKEQDTGHYSRNNTINEGQSRLCGECSYSLPNIQI